MDNEGSAVIVKETSESSVRLTNLTAATPYTVEVEFLFVGGHVGPRTRRDVMTSDGSKSHDGHVITLCGNAGTCQ